MTPLSRFVRGVGVGFLAIHKGFSMADSNEQRVEALQRIEEAARNGATELNLLGMALTALPFEIGNLTNLTSLDLRRNQLTALPPEIGNLTNLTELYLSSNQLTALPPEIGNLTNLTELYLNSNQLTALPPEIGNLTNLTKLDLGRNQLTALPPEIGNLTNLTKLNLGGNQLTSLPPEIGNLTNLTELYLSRNQLTALPPEIAKRQAEGLLKIVGLHRRSKTGGSGHLRLRVTMGEFVPEDDAVRLLVDLYRAMNEYHIAGGGQGLVIDDWKIMAEAGCPAGVRS